MRATAVFVERHLNHYRTSFYENLRNALGADGVRMRLLTGRESASEKAKRDGVRLA